MDQSLLIAEISHIDVSGTNHSLLIAKCAHLELSSMNQSLLIAKRAQLELARMPQRNAPQNCGASQRLATPRNASQRLATRLQHAPRALGTLNGRSATRRQEKAKNHQMQCSEGIVLTDV